MASVTSLDADMRNLRLSRYTPQAASEARRWIESVLGEPLPADDLLDALKDGVALCKLANLAIQAQRGAIKFKASSMPFIQMENISHFLKACELAPLSLPAHDRFLTVDLFEAKDPAQVLQCLSAFSRQANKLNPSKFPTTIGPKKVNSTLSPTSTGDDGTDRQKAGQVSSWSKRSDEDSTLPAWNIHQYGYMGGASQGNQGVAFGARRQITSQAPAVPSMAGKEKLRREKELAAVKEANERDLQAKRAAEEEERERFAEEQRWEVETKRAQDEERKRLEAQKREWEEQEREWTEREATRQQEDAALQASLSQRASQKPASLGEGILRGQSLAEYQREQAIQAKGQSKPAHARETSEQLRVKELEEQLEEARERERQYQAEREERLQNDQDKATLRSSATVPDRLPVKTQDDDLDWAGDERAYLRRQWQDNREQPAVIAPPSLPQRPLSGELGPSSSLSDMESSLSIHRETLPKEVIRALPTVPHPSQERDQNTASATSTIPQPSRHQSPFARPLSISHKIPESYKSRQPIPNRTDTYLSTHNPPADPIPQISTLPETGHTSLEQARLKDERLASQQQTKAGAWASKSLLEREMERERERQREWETNQEALKNAPRPAQIDDGPSWDVNQYGYLGGDNMNKGSSVGSGINIGGRRQIVGPRPPPQS